MVLTYFCKSLLYFQKYNLTDLNLKNSSLKLLAFWPLVMMTLGIVQLPNQTIQSQVNRPDWTNEG
jgi:hypothetical protein